MKKFLFLLSISIAYLSAKSQERYVGKSQRFIMDSFSKINYRQIDGQIRPDGQYTLGFRYDLMQDSNAMKKFLDTTNRTSSIAVLSDDTIRTISYSFLFDTKDICVKSFMYYTNGKDYQRVISDLNDNYLYKVKGQIWLNASGDIEVTLTKSRFSDGFTVEFHKVNK